MDFELNKKFLTTKNGKKFQRNAKIKLFLERLARLFGKKKQLALHGDVTDTDDAPSLARTLGITIPQAAKIITAPPEPQTLQGPTSPWDNRNIEFHTLRGIYKGKGFQDMYGQSRPTACGFRIERNENDKIIQVILSLLPHNMGTSLSAMYQDFATDIFWQFLFRTPAEDIEWYEYQPATSSGLPPTLERIFLKWEDEKFSLTGKRLPMETPKEWLDNNIVLP